MSKTIWKIHLKQTGASMVEMPKGAQVLSVGWDGGHLLSLWAKVLPEQEVEERQFVVLGTGWPIDEKRELKFIGTVSQAGNTLICHVFEVIG